MGVATGDGPWEYGGREHCTSRPMAGSGGTVFRDLSVKSIVIPPASTGTTAISRAAVQGYGSDLRSTGHAIGLWMLWGMGY